MGHSINKRISLLFKARMSSKLSTDSHELPFCVCDSVLSLPVAAAPLVPRSFTSIFTLCRTFDTHSLSSAGGQEHAQIGYIGHLSALNLV